MNSVSIKICNGIPFPHSCANSNAITQSPCKNKGLVAAIGIVSGAVFCACALTTVPIWGSCVASVSTAILLGGSSSTYKYCKSNQKIHPETAVLQAIEISQKKNLFGSKHTHEESKSKHDAAIHLDSSPSSFSATVINKKDKKIVAAIIALTGHKIFLKKQNKAITRADYAQLIQDDPKNLDKPESEHFTYSLFVSGKVEEQGRIVFKIDRREIAISTEIPAQKATETPVQKPLLWVDDLESRTFRHGGHELIKTAVWINKLRGFKHKIILSAQYNAQGFYWRSGFNSSEPWTCVDRRSLVTSFTNKLKSANSDTIESLNLDSEFPEAQKIIARAVISQQKKMSFVMALEKEVIKLSQTLDITEVKNRWPELLRRRDFFDPTAKIDEMILDELACARADLPRFEQERRNQPDTSRFKGCMELDNIDSIESWEKLVVERTLRLKQRTKEVLAEANSFLHSLR